MPIATDAFTAIGLLVALLVTLQNLVRYVKAGDWNGVIGILLAVATGVVLVVWAAHADVTATLHLIRNAPALGKLDGGSQALLGVSVGSVGPVAVDVIKALDNTRSSAKPKIVGPAES